MNKLFTLTLGAILLLIFSCDSENGPAEPFIVSGVVTDETGNPLSDVAVNSVVDTVYSDGTGFYSLVAFPTGAIEYKKDGFQNWIELVRNRKMLDVTLLKNAANGNETVYESVAKSQLCDNGATISVEEVSVKDFGLGTGTMTWTRDKVWILKNKVFVNPGQTLTIEPGTIIKGSSGQIETTCVLVVARGGKIMAEGTPNLPIIFTADSDAIVRDTDGNLCKGSSLTKDDKGLWGGVILLGKAKLNSAPGETLIEGIPESENRGLYGGNKDDDYSGIMRYVSIRHCGTEIAIGSEVNGLTFGGVGSQTIIEYIETFACNDDGFEFFGGTVSTRYLLSAFNGDDAFDYDEGWRGSNQFWLAFQGPGADRGGEHDGGTDPETGTPFSTPLISNATYIGFDPGNGKEALIFRDNAGGEYHNSIFMRYAFGAVVEFTGENAQDSYRNLKDGALVFKNNILYNIANQPVFTLANVSNLPNNAPATVAAFEFTHNYFNSPGNKNVYADPGLDAVLLPLPGSLAAQPGELPDNAFFQNVAFKGCFAPGNSRWMDGWTRAASEF